MTERTGSGDRPSVDVAAFDSADLAAAILGLDEPAEVASETGSPQDGLVPHRSGALGWVLTIALVLAVCIAISMAVQMSADAPAEPLTPERPTCGGLFDDC